MGEPLDAVHENRGIRLHGRLIQGCAVRRPAAQRSAAQPSAVPQQSGQLVACLWRCRFWTQRARRSPTGGRCRTGRWPLLCRAAGSRSLQGSFDTGAQRTWQAPSLGRQQCCRACRSLARQHRKERLVQEAGHALTDGWRGWRRGRGRAVARAWEAVRAHGAQSVRLTSWGAWEAVFECRTVHLHGTCPALLSPWRRAGRRRGRRHWGRRKRWRGRGRRHGRRR